MGNTLSSSYCGCCELSTGCIVIGFFNVAFALLGIVTFTVIAGLFWPDASYDDARRTASIILLVASVVSLASGITLLIGVYMEDPDCVLAHLVIDLIAIILCFVGILILVPVQAWYITLIGCIFTLVGLYHWLIAFSYYIEIC